MLERTDVALAELTTLRLGGPARRLVTATTTAELVEAVTSCDRAGEPVLLLGGGSNLVVSDDGFDGTVVQIATSGVTRRGGDVIAAAGEHWDLFVASCVEAGLAGVECLSGIPGLVGATPVQNVGAYGQDVSQSVTAVRALDRRSAEVVTMTPEQCGFGYRSSVFKHRDDHVVLAVGLHLEPSPASAPLAYPDLAHRLGAEPGERAPLAAVRAAVLALRTGKGMVLDPDDHDTWSAGSFFTNPLLDAGAAAALPGDAPRWPDASGRTKTSAAWLIEQAGFGRGYGTGPARLSTKHPLALTNRGGASTEDLLALAREVRDAVRARFGVTLEPEPVLVGVAL
jgi:UDP-N-acetylmuramate dehydrogenase